MLPTTPLAVPPDSLPSRVLLVENSRVFTQVVSEAITQRLGLPVTVVATLGEARAVLDDPDEWFLVLTGLVLADGDRDAVVEFFLSRELPTVVVSGVYDEDIRQRVLQREIIDYVVKSAPGAIDYLVWLVQRLDRNRRITALVVDDAASARAHAASLLALYGFRVVEAGSGAEGLAAIAADPSIRLAVVDQEMPGMDGVTFTHQLRATHPRDRVSVVGISGSREGSLVARFLKSGANDFLHKPFSREEFFCRISQNVDQLELIGTLQDLATRDFLTGLPNRRHFLERGQERLREAVEAGRPATVAMLDIDHFKRINDTWGHEAGDLALRAIAAEVGRHAADSDLAARFGGEEFCLVSVGREPDHAREWFESLRARVEALRIRIGEETLQATISIGLAHAGAGADLHRLLLEADRMLYVAKAGGRNRVEVDPAAASREDTPPAPTGGKRRRTAKT